MTTATSQESARAVTRSGLVAAITAFLAGHDAARLTGIRHLLERTLDEAGHDALVALGRALAVAGTEWDYYPADSLARHIHHVLADELLAPGSQLEGAEHLGTVDDRPVVIISNHLSYSDANLLEVLLHRAGGEALARRLTAMAGPKVYSNPARRFSSLCFGTIKTPQSSSRSSEDAVMHPRDVARLARRVIELAQTRLRAGDALIVYAEGTRSRTAEMQPFLPGVARYLDQADSWVLPVGLTGTEGWFPVGATTIHPVRTRARLGRPFPAARLEQAAGGDRRLMVDALGVLVADLLPPEYQGTYGEARPHAPARRVAASLRTA